MATVSDTTGILIAIFTGLTAIGGFALVVITRRSHAHDKATAGTEGSLVIRAALEYVEPFLTTVLQIPTGWERTDSRYFAVYFYNRAPYSIQPILRTKSVRIGWSARPCEVAGGADANLDTQILLEPQEPVVAFFTVRRPKKWESNRNFKRIVRMRIGTPLEQITFRARVWFKPMPPHAVQVSSPRPAQQSPDAALTPPAST